MGGVLENMQRNVLSECLSNRETWSMLSEAHIHIKPRICIHSMVPKRIIAMNSKRKLNICVWAMKALNTHRVCAMLTITRSRRGGLWFARMAH